MHGARTSSERLGIFGGTFDPIHNGHVRAARAAIEQLQLDRLLLVVADQPWQKADRTLAPAADRLAMAEAAVADIPGVEVSDLEIKRGGESYTADTLTELHRQHPDAQLFLIVGADAAAGIDSWHQVETVRKLATIAVVDRAPYAYAVAPSETSVTVTYPELSSTMLRQRLMSGKSLEGLVPPAVADYIAAHGLYR